MSPSAFQTSPRQTSPRRRLFNLSGEPGGGQMAAVEFGPAERPLDVVFLHANGFNGMTYRQILAPLGAGLRILSVDQRGHGRSTLSTPIDNHSWQRYADDLLALLATLPEPPRLLAGHSMGGAAILLASQRMAKGTAPNMVLFDPVMRLPEDVPDAATMAESPLTRGAKRRNAVFPSPQAALESYRGRGAFKSWTDAMIEDYLSDGLRPLEDGQFTLSCTPAWEAANFMTSYETGVLPALLHPAAAMRILRAEIETTCAIGDDAEAWRGQPQVRVETVPGTTHFLPMEQPQRVRDALLEALSATDVASGRR